MRGTGEEKEKDNKRDQWRQSNRVARIITPFFLRSISFPRSVDCLFSRADELRDGFQFSLFRAFSAYGKRLTDRTGGGNG